MRSAFLPSRFFFLSFLLFSLSAGSFVSVEEELRFEAKPAVGLVTGERVNVRASSSLSSEVISQLPRGSEVQVLSIREGWYKIRLPFSVSVYVAKAFLQLEEGKAKVVGSQVQVRAGAGRAFTSLGFLSEGERVGIRRVMGEWVEIDPPPSCAGWVHSKYVELLPFDEEDKGV